MGIRSKKQLSLSTEMEPITLIKLTFALSVAFTFASTLHALTSSK